jgi:hypothetical protein
MAETQTNTPTQILESAEVRTWRMRLCLDCECSIAGRARCSKRCRECAYTAKRRQSDPHYPHPKTAAERQRIARLGGIAKAARRRTA